MSVSGFTTPVRSRSPVVRRDPPNAPMVVRLPRTLNDDSTRGVSRAEDNAFADLVSRLRAVAPLLTPPRTGRSASPPGGSPRNSSDNETNLPVLLNLPVAVTPPSFVRRQTPPPIARRGVVRSHIEAFGSDEDSDEDLFFATPLPKRSRPAGDE